MYLKYYDKIYFIGDSQQFWGADHFLLSCINNSKNLNKYYRLRLRMDWEFTLEKPTKTTFPSSSAWSTVEKHLKTKMNGRFTCLKSIWMISRYSQKDTPDSSSRPLKTSRSYVKQEIQTLSDSWILSKN